MECLKCGKETKESQVFCEHCLNGMEDYPVTPGAPIHLPSSPALASAKKQGHKKKVLPPEEQVLQLRRSVRRWARVAVLLGILLTVVGAMLVQNVMREESLNLGKNYTIDLKGNTP